MAKKQAAPKQSTSTPAVKPKGGAPRHVETTAAIRRDIGMGNPETGLAKAPMNALAMTYDQALNQYTEHIGKAMQALTCAIAMKDLTPPQLGRVFALSKSTEDAAKEAAKLARARSLDVILKQGLPVGEKGLSRELDLGSNTYIRATIQKSGTDPEKFEGALRAKGATVTKYMDTITKYKLKDGTTSQDLAQADGVFTLDEIRAMDYEPDYRVDRPKERKGGGES